MENINLDKNAGTVLTKVTFGFTPHPVFVSHVEAMGMCVVEGQTFTTESYEVGSRLGGRDLTLSFRNVTSELIASFRAPRDVAFYGSGYRVVCAEYRRSAHRPTTMTVKLIKL